MPAVGTKGDEDFYLQAQIRAQRTWRARGISIKKVLNYSS